MLSGGAANQFVFALQKRLKIAELNSAQAGENLKMRNEWMKEKQANTAILSPI